MTEWISSLEASRRIRAERFSEEDLIGWAEQSKLRTRANKGRFCNDDDDEREFPLDPPKDEIKLLASGPWPDIPSDFWRWVKSRHDGSEALWGAGIFAATVIFDPEIGDFSDSEHIKLFGVTFNNGDLDNLLAGAGETHPTVPMYSARGRKPDWQRRETFAAIMAVELYMAGKDRVSPSDLNKSKLHEMVAAAAGDPGMVPSRKIMNALVEDTLRRLNERTAKK